MILKDRVTAMEAKRETPDHYICFVNHGETRDEALKRIGLSNKERQCVILVQWLA